MAEFNLDWSGVESVNDELVGSVTEALQAQERFYNKLRHNKHNVKQHVLENCGKLLDEMRDMKSDLDGSAVKFVRTEADEKILQEQVKPLILMHVPRSLTPEVKVKITDLVIQSFKGTCKQVLFIGLVTCPWYEAAHEDRGQAARHNGLLVVYINHPSQFLAPVNPHVREQGEVVDQGWFYGTEMFHFASHLVRGKSRFVEMLTLPESAVIYQHNTWTSLLHNLDLEKCARLKGFLEQCRGQAVGAVGKKKKSGKFSLRDGATLYEFCESFRLLNHVSSIISGRLPSLEALDRSGGDSIVQESLHLLTTAYQEGGVTKEHLFSQVMRWREEVDRGMKSLQPAAPPQIEAALGRWMTEARAGADFNPQPLAIALEDSARVSELLGLVGGPVAKMEPANILMVARAGSYLYGLDTPTSDIDYVVIYATPIQDLLMMCKRPVESVENRGPQLQCEYGAYEARLFAEMLWKGSVVILELVFASDLEYTSTAWRVLHDNRHLFLTERAVLQYFGLIKNNLTMIKNGRFKDNPGRERKLFYQIFHKLWSLAYFVEAKPPPVKCSGETQEFIMHIRTGNLEGEFSREYLLKQAEEEIQLLRNRLAERKTRLPENVDYDFLLKWLLAVRNWHSDS